MGNKIIIPETNGEVRIIGQPIIEKKTNKEVMDTYVYIDNKIIHIREKEKPLIFKNFLNIQKIFL